MSTLDALRASGAARHDPLRMHFIERLAQRAQESSGSLREQLQARLQRAIDELAGRHASAREQVASALPASLQRFPAAAERLRQLADAGQFQALRRELLLLQGRQQVQALAELRQALSHETGEPDPQAAPRELKTLRAARSTWATLSIERQLAQARQSAPHNAGPINSHMLMLRSLDMMGEISPDYLHRFIAWADALLRLSGGEADKAEKPEKARKTGKPARARKPRAQPLEE